MFSRAVVIALGPAAGPAASALAARLQVLGVDPEIVTGQDPVTLDRASLLAVGRGPDPAWHDGTGRTLTRWEAARVLAHEMAWDAASRADDPVLVVESRAKLAPDLAVTLETVADAIGDGWDLLHLDARRDGLAYVIRPTAAATLGASMPDVLVPVGAFLESAELDGFLVEPALAEPGPVPPEGDERITDHLRVLEAAGDRDAFAARLAGICADAGPGDVVLAIPAGRSRLLRSPKEVLAEVARTGARLETAPGPAVLGRADEVARWLGRGADPGAAPGTLLHHVPAPGDGGTVVIGGRLLASATSTTPLAVTAASPDALAWLDDQLTDDGSRDLARILRYDGAVDPASRAGAVEVAPELLQTPFWTPAFCATVVRAAEAVGAFEPSPEDPVPGHEVSLAAISPRLFAHLEDDLYVRVWPLLQSHWPYADFNGLRDAFVIKYAPGQQEELRIHHDVAQVSASVRLNAGYEGGVLEFPRQGWTNAAVPVGSLVAWPSLVTHPHQTSPLLAGVKYGLTIWFELPHGANE